MAASPEKLAEVDRELDAFGKSAAHLDDVIARARGWARSVDDLEGALAGLGVVVEPPPPPKPRAQRTEKPAQSKSPAPRAEKATAPRAEKATAPRAEKATAPRTEKAPTPHSEKAPVMRAEKFAEEPNTELTPVTEEPPPVSDITGLTVDELFADAEPAPPSAPAPDAGLAGLFDSDLPEPVVPESVGGLADLFDDEPAPEPAPTGGIAELFADDGGSLGDEDDEPTMMVSAESFRAYALPENDAPAQKDEAPRFREETTTTLSALDVDELAVAEDEFELLVDEEVLELEDEG